MVQVTTSPPPTQARKLRGDYIPRHAVIDRPHYGPLGHISRLTPQSSAETPPIDPVSTLVALAALERAITVAFTFPAGNTLAALGAKIRKQRRRQAMTLDDLSDVTFISKPYLSLIETARMKTLPSDEAIARLEAALKFNGELAASIAYLRTPAAVRDLLTSMLVTKGGAA